MENFDWPQAEITDTKSGRKLSPHDILERTERQSSLKEQAEVLMEKAEKIAHAAKQYKLVKQFLHLKGGLENINDADFQQFARENERYFDEAGMVLALAMLIEQEALDEKRKLH